MGMLTEEEKTRVRAHLGYMLTSFGSTNAAASLQFGVSRPVQTAFLVESAINVLLTNEFALDRVRSILATMDHYECLLKNVGCMLGVAQVGEIRLRDATPGQTHADLIEKEYIRWGYRLADALGVPLYPYSRRYTGSGPGRSVPIIRS